LKRKLRIVAPHTGGTAAVPIGSISQRLLFRCTLRTKPPQSASPTTRTKIIMTEDAEVRAWNNCHSDDLWIFDKLLLSKKFNYLCAPGCVAVPKAEFYVVRPVMNLYGMGVGAEVKWLTPADSTAVPPGYFWCEQFKGRHLSIDYDQKGVQLNSVEGLRRPNAPLYKFSEWKVVKEIRGFPDVLKNLVGTYEFYNVEMIGDKIIEVHLRQNHDPIQNDLRVCWEKDRKHKNLRLVPNHEDADGYLPEKRLGFYISRD
jgi:hypothetical protein